MDRYDEAIEYLITREDEIHQAWLWPDAHKAGCLFTWCTFDGKLHYGEPAGRERPESISGDVLQVHDGTRKAIGPDAERITAEIRADSRLPKDIIATNLGHLPLIADWQRKLDVFWSRKYELLRSDHTG